MGIPKLQVSWLAVCVVAANGGCTVFGRVTEFTPVLSSGLPHSQELAHGLYFVLCFLLKQRSDLHSLYVIKV